MTPDAPPARTRLPHLPDSARAGSVDPGPAPGARRPQASRARRAHASRAGRAHAPRARRPHASRARRAHAPRALATVVPLPAVLPLAAVLLLAAVAACGDREPPGGSFDAPGGTSAPASAAGDAPSSADPFPVLDAAEACPGAGYLCQGLASGEELRIQRWPGTTPMLTIRVPPPPVEDAAMADALRRAVVRGFLAWDRHPFPLRVLDRPGDGGGGARTRPGDGEGGAGARTGDAGPRPDVAVTWRESLAEGMLGRVHFQWGHLDGRELGFRVEAFELALALPAPGGRTLTPEDLERSTAHEMGHALGLLHSDDPRDLMFPSNTASRLSVRDYRTLEALYALPNGARIVRR